MRKIVSVSLAAALVAVVCGQVTLGYDEVVSAQSLFATVTTDTPNTLGGSVNDGLSTSYHVVKRSSPSISWIVKVDGYNTGAPVSSVLTQWDNNLNMGRAMGVSGTDVIIGDGTLDTIYKFNTTTGVSTEYVSKAAILAQTGGDAIQGNYSFVRPDGELVFWEDDTDSLWVTTGVGTVQSYLTNEAMANSQGVAVGSGRISSQLAFVGDVMYFGEGTNTDAIYAYDPAAAATNPGDNISQVLSQADILAVTGATTANFADMIYNPADGLIYFRELTSKSFMAFDPTDAANTLATILTTAELEAGPAGSSFTIGPASIVDGEFAWSSNPNGYYRLPEPASLMLIGLATLVLRRR